MESTSPTLQLFADEFLESAGAILFSPDFSQICVVHDLRTGNVLLPKGRRNCNESRKDAAIREIREETGHQCAILPLTMSTRSPPTVEKGFTPDVPREENGLCDPFALTIREEGARSRKLIWWFVGYKTGEQDRLSASDEGWNRPVWINCEDAKGVLAFKGDVELVQQAMNLVETSLNT
jgi:8-oxo-dGTP pyrophosphatase MutT (NUDIX family)